MLNNVTLMGRLVADPEIRTTSAGKSVANFRIAVDRSFVRQGEQRQADFITIVVWEKTAEFIGKHFSKGSMIAIQGKIQTRSYEDSNGNKRTAFEVVATEVSFCGSKNEGNNNSGNPNSSPSTPAYSPAPTDYEGIGSDDDLPF